MFLVHNKFFQHNIILVVMCILTCVGCSKDNKDFQDVLLVGTEYMEVTSKDASYTFDLLSNSNFALSSDVDWVSFEQETGEKGKQKISFSVAKNEDEERSGVIQVRINDELNREILVVQEAGTINVFYVKVDGTGDGRSWEQASSINSALQQATSGSEIHIAEGTYIPSKTLTGGDAAEDGDRTFEIDKNIMLIGGYAANAGIGSSPDPGRYKTIFSGKQASGAEAFHVVAITAPMVDQEQVEIQGITIRDGNGSDRNTRISVNGQDYSRGNGAGMIIGAARVVLRQVSVIENKTSTIRGTAGYAAGIFVMGGSELHMYDSKVDENQAQANGGGLWVDNSKAFIFNSSFDNNSARGTAAGVHAYPNAVIYMYNSSVSGNSGTSYGAAVYARDGSKAFLVNCLINGNTSTSKNGGGGVMLYDNCEANIISSTISQNDIDGPGGGVYRRLNTNKLTIINSIISGNKQISGSSDVDVYEEDAAVPLFRSSAIGTRVYDASNAVISGVSFQASSMLNSVFLPIGGDNPALEYGMDAAILKGIGLQYTPPLDSAIDSDFHRNSREARSIMGAIVE